MKNSSLAERPISAADFETIGGGYLFWALLPALSDLIIRVVRAITDLILSEFFYVSGASHDIWIRIMVLLPVALLSLREASRYRSAQRFDSSKLPIVIGLAGACVVASMLSAYLGPMLQSFRYDLDIEIRFANAAIFNPSLYMVPVLAWLVMVQSCFRGIVMGIQLKFGAPAGTAILVATGFQLLAVGISIALTLVWSIFSGWFDLGDFFLRQIVSNVVGVALIGVTYGALRVVTGRLWPCIAVGVLALLFSPGIDTVY